MAEQHPAAPMTPEEAAAWVRSPRQAGVGIRDAAILSRLQLGADETGILHVGSACGTFALTARRALGLLPGEPANIVGIDNCQTMVDIANGLLEAAANRGFDVRGTVQFRCMDAFRLGRWDTIYTIQSLFPRGISTIVATDVFDDLGNAVTRQAVRDLAALLAPGGRVVLNVQYQPRCWSAAHLVRNAHEAPSLVGIIALAPRELRHAAPEQVRPHCRRIAGTSSSGSAVFVDRVECGWMDTVWGAFLDSISPGRYAAGGRVSDEAYFDPAVPAFYNVAVPAVRRATGAVQYCRAAVGHIVESMRDPDEPEQNAEWVQQTSERLYQQVVRPDGATRLGALFEEWLEDFVDIDDDDLPRFPLSYHIAHEIVSRQRDEIRQLHGITDWNGLYLTPASVLVSFHVS